MIHFSHAYTEPPGNTDRHTRTKYALKHLGPSVLAAGLTTLAGAVMMLFTIVYFFRIFAIVLFFAIIQAIVGSFVVFLVFTDCMGPSNPTYLYDKLLGCSETTEEESHEGTRTKKSQSKAIVDGKSQKPVKSVAKQAQAGAPIFVSSDDESIIVMDEHEC